MTTKKVKTMEDKTNELTSAKRLLFPRLAPFYAQGSPIAYLIFRIAFGIIILTHGIPKLLGIPHGNIQDPMAGLTHIIGNIFQLPFAPQLAFMVMIIETLGAVCISLGLMTRFFCAAFAIQMIFASYFHAPKFVWGIGGYEYPLVLFLIAAYMAVRGGGTYSLDRKLPKEL